MHETANQLLRDRENFERGNEVVFSEYKPVGPVLIRVNFGEPLLCVVWGWEKDTHTVTELPAVRTNINDGRPVFARAGGGNHQAGWQLFGLGMGDDVAAGGLKDWVNPEGLVR